MTIYCVVCKKEPIPGDKSCSFHKFPDDAVLKQQWLTAIERCSATKYTKICSDHFDKNAFVDSDGYTQKRRLLPTAVPCRLVNTNKELSDTAGVSSNIVTKDHTQSNSQNEQCTSNDGVDVTIDLFFSSNNDLPANITNTVGENEQKFCEPASRKICHSSVAVDLDTSTAFLNEDSVTESTKDLSTQLFSQQSMFNEPTSIDNHTDLKRSLPLRDITNVSPNKRLHSHNECESTLVKKVCEEPQPNRMHANLKKSQPSSIDVSNIPPSKKIRFYDGSQPVQLSRQDFTSHEAWTRFLKFYIYKKRQIESFRKKDARKNRTIENIKELVTKLREDNATAAADYLQNLPEHVKEIISRMKNNQQTSPFPAHLKTFARTLHFHSPAAYEMVRKSFLQCLPCVETLNRWNCSKNYKPGVSEEIINHISEMVKNESKKGKKLIFNVTFDEMGIKEWAKYCQQSKEWKEFENFGGQLQQSDVNGQPQKAKKALVFMLVNINGGFKTPVAYYLTNSVSGDGKSILLRDLLIMLHERQINVVSVTFDGDESNQKSCKLLGANFDYTNKETFRPYFLHTANNDSVYVFFDACHMLKLIQNYLALKGPFIYNNKEIIDWIHIQNLNEKQYSEGLHCACKIRNRHVFFHNEKMKVFLAAQVFSSSTAAALIYLEKELKDPMFNDSAATATFCKLIDEMFDILNSKNKFCKTPSRNAMTEANLPELKKKIDSFKAYVENLEVNVQVTIKKRKKVNDENRCNNSLNEIESETKKEKEIVIKKVSVLKCTSVRTGSLGFIICLHNFYSLCEKLFQEKVVSYVLSYKLSQDHVEMFFALIRRMNGFTTNPTVIQFQSAYKKLLLNNMNVTVPANANCLPQDTIL